VTTVAWGGTRRVPMLRLSAGAARLVAIAALAGVAAMLAWSAVPAFWGWHPTIVTSASMSPSLHRGDVAVTSAPPAGWQPAVGQVVVVPDPLRPGRTRIHRIAGVDEHGMLITRGDANGSADSFRTAPADVRGIGRLLIPRVALASLEMREGRPVLFVAQSAAVLMAFALALRPGSLKWGGARPTGGQDSEPAPR
jgi:signal peptidase